MEKAGKTTSPCQCCTDWWPGEHVDDKALKFTKGWYAEFETPALTENKTVKISCKVKDEMTGEMMEAFTDFPYEIKVE